MLSKLFARNSKHGVRARFIPKIRSFCNRAEEWRDIIGYPNYQVSNMGNVHNTKLKRNMRLDPAPFKRMNKPIQVVLSQKYKIVKRMHLSRLVLMHFNPDPDMHEKYAVHIDRDKYNNKLSNLEWATCAQKHSSASGESTKKAVILQYGTQILHFASQTECRLYLLSIGVRTNHSQISKCCHSGRHINGYSLKNSLMLKSTLEQRIIC